MSHSRVSLGRIAFPCITGGVEGRLRDQGRGGAPEKAPGPACRARRSRLRPFFSHRPPRHLSTLASFSFVQQVFVAPGAGRVTRGGYGLRRPSPCPQSASRRPLAHAFLFFLKVTAERARAQSGKAYLRNTIQVTYRNESTLRFTCKRANRLFRLEAAP